MDANITRGTYILVMQAAARYGDLKAARAWFDEALRAGFEPGLGAFTTLINACVQAGNMTAVLDCLQDMRTADVKPSIATYTTLITGVARTRNSSDLQLAERFYLQMRDEGLIPDVVVYTALINAAGKKSNPAAAERWFSEMQAAKVEPNALSFAGLVTAHGRVSNIDRAEECMSELLSRDSAADISETVFGALINEYAKLGNVKKAEEWFSRMGDLNVRPTVVQYTQLLKCYAACASDCTDRAVSTLEQMIADCVKPNDIAIRTFRQAVDADTYREAQARFDLEARPMSARGAQRQKRFRFNSAQFDGQKLLPGAST